MSCNFATRGWVYIMAERFSLVISDVGPGLKTFDLAELFFFKNGSTTSFEDTFVDAAESSAHDNPVVSNIDGFFPAIFVSAGIRYNIVLRDKNGVRIWSTKNYISDSDIIATSIFKETVIGTFNAIYLPSDDVNVLQMMATGAGGGGGGVDGQGVGTAANGDPGGGGGTAIKTTTTIDPSYRVIMGRGGTGGASGNNDGTAGGNTSIESENTVITCNGGAKGIGKTGTAGTVLTTGALGGSASGGDTPFNFTGANGTSTITVGGVMGLTNKSGGSFWGDGRSPFTSSTPPADVPGLGGSSEFEVSVSSRKGDDGSNGIVVFTEYF